MRPDKAKVVDEIWDEERIRSFLDKTPMGDEADPDYSVLLHGYRSMRAEDFQRFLQLFCAQGRNLDARSNAGQTLLETIAGHRKAAEFRDILRRASAG
jgi:hypothetical protein